MLKKQPLAILCAVLLGLTWVGSVIAAETTHEILVAMASFKNVCGGNTGKVCPGTTPATPTPPVAASPVIPAPKPLPTPVTPAPPASTPAPSPAPTLPSVTTAVPPPSLTTTPTPTAHPMVAATLLGQTGEDVVGTYGGTADGVKDVHIKLTGVSGTIKGVRITGLDGIWETPANGKNWLVAIRPQSDPSVVDLYFDYFKVISSYMVTLTFSDGATQAFQAATNNPGSIYLAAPAPTPTALTSTPPTVTPPPVLTPSPTPSIPSTGMGGIVSLTGDPFSGTVGFARSHWASSINKMIVFLTGNGPFKDNSVRAYDPRTNSWEYLWANSNGTNGPEARDNYASLYNSRLDELWIWGGSYLEAKAGALRSGRFSIAQRKWVASGINDSDAFSGMVDLSAVGGMPWNGADPATAWSTQLDMGMVCCGSANAISGDFYLIEPNSGGSTPYKATKLGGTLPPPRAQAMNLMVAAGTNFYLFSGWNGKDASGNYTYTNDFWKFDGVNRVWTQLANPPEVTYQPTATYDSDKNLVVAWVNDHIYAYHIDTNQWENVTPSGLPCVQNQVGVYAPTAKMHIFEGGAFCAAGNATYSIWGISLSGSGAIIAPTPTAPTPTSTSISNPVGPSGYTFCVKENQTCSFSGTKAVAYGANGQFNYKNVTAGTSCTNSVFGDPISNTAKACYTSDVVMQTPTPTTTITPTPTPPSTSTASPTPSGASSCYAGLCLPLRTWTIRPLPDRGIGPCTQGNSGGCKEVHPGFNSKNGRMYLFGGDYTGRAPSGYWGSTYSYSLLNGDWITEYPNVGIPGDTIMDNVADEIAWTYDSKRNLFYWIGGFGGSCCYGYPIGTQSNGVTYTDPPIAFNPDTKKWSTLNFPRLSGQHAVYDPVTDSLFQLTDNGLVIYHIDTGAQETLGMPGNLNLGLLQRNNIYDIDVQGRAVYFINHGNFFQGQPDRITNLVRYNIDSRTFEDLGPAPQQDNLYYPLTAWDSVNKVFLWWTEWEWPLSTLWIYHPDTRKWESDPLIQPEGFRPTGNFFAFDPQHNALMLMGCNFDSAPGVNIDGCQHYLFLYRYGTGK